MLVLEEVLLVGALLGWKATPSSRLGLRGRLYLCRQCVLPFSLERWFWQLIDFWVWAYFLLPYPGDNLFCMFALLDQLLSSTTFSYSYL